MTRRRHRPIGLLLDLFVYAPVGFLIEAPRLVPEMIQTGRSRVAGAGTMGRLAVDVARNRLVADRRRPYRPPPPAAPSSDVEDPAELDGEIVVDVADGPVAPGDLPIHGYDLLAASQVVARLTGLDAAQLDAVEAHEQAHRNRRTVLARIAQLRRP